MLLTSVLLLQMQVLGVLVRRQRPLLLLEVTC
jgi:hypothetical protein